MLLSHADDSSSSSTSRAPAHPPPATESRAASVAKQRMRKDEATFGEGATTTIRLCDSTARAGRATWQRYGNCPHILRPGGTPGLGRTGYGCRDRADQAEGGPPRDGRAAVLRA